MLSVLEKANLALILLMYQGIAHATDIGAPDDGVFAKLGALMQDLVDFFEGPLGLAVSIIGMSLALIVWVLGARSEDGLGRVGKAFIAIILLINVPGFIVAMQAY